MSDAREIVSLEIAAGMLCVRPGGRVHTFRQVGPALLGADWSRDEIVEAMDKAPAIDISGEAAQALGHGLCIVDEHGPLFIETQKEHAEPLSVWTLFDSPADAPGQYVLRRFESHPVEPRPTSDVWASDNIEVLREIVRGMGLYCLGRLEADEPQIVESWI